MHLRLLAVLLLFAGLSILVPQLHIGTPPASSHNRLEDAVVYVSDGPLYHTAFCQHLGQTHYAMSVSEAARVGYSACPICGGAPAVRK